LGFVNGIDFFTRQFVSLFLPVRLAVYFFSASHRKEIGKIPLRSLRLVYLCQELFLMLFREAGEKYF